MTENSLKQPFGDRLSNALKARKTPLCVGIDPHISLMPNLFRATGQAEQIEKLYDFSYACIKAAQDRVPAVKPQVALFEKFGPEGMRVLQQIGQDAKEAGLLVIMDAKRGDIGSTSTAYADAWLGANAPFYADALTVNPFLGLDTLEPFVHTAIKNHAGLFILLRTSNPGSSDLQGLQSENKPVYQHLASKLAPMIDLHKGKTGWSSIGVVVGATNPSEAGLLRKQLNSSPFLIPGFGAQGADASMALSGLTYDHKEPCYQGGLINSSRAITFADNTKNVTTHSEFVSAVIHNIHDSIEKLK
ncbi:orotidine-5'-phosphate decarboxylase [Alphaproteobacteria bacterium]|nr:orotidine-5'-phosphate decarboxylase [Alphaproteobacteria bacterium]